MKRLQGEARAESSHLEQRLDLQKKGMWWTVALQQRVKGIVAKKLGEEQVKS